jgi:1-acyl-sn-glycerol-3-phosphate acyltransferase
MAFVEFLPLDSFIRSPLQLRPQRKSIFDFVFAKAASSLAPGPSPSQNFCECCRPSGYESTVSNWCYRLTRGASRVVFSPFARLQVWRAPGAAEPAGAAVLVSNHISHFDPVLLTVVFARNIDWMTTEEFYANPLGAAWLRALNTFPVDRSRPDHRALRLGAERLRAGRTIGVFPEGGIRAGATSVLGGAMPKGGATALARLADVPMIPCIIFGSDRLYGARNWRPGPPRTPVWVGIGAPFSVSHVDDAQANLRLADVMREIGAATIAHFALGPDDLPATPQHRKGRDLLA